MLSPRKTVPFIKPDLVTPYDYSHFTWYDPSNPSYSAKFVYLAKVVCAVGDSFYIRNMWGQWEEVKNKAAVIARMNSEHTGVRQHFGGTITISLDDIKAFLTLGMLYFNDRTYAPLQDDFLTFAGQRRLNIYYDTRIDGQTDHIQYCEEFLKIIRNSLCNAPDEVGLEPMLSEIFDPTCQSPFRWVMHWLAARYQRPGFATQTNLWFCGRRGVGKGSLIAMMKRVLGQSAVGKIGKADIVKGWSDSMFGCDLLEWDEFKGNGWHDFNTFIKEMTGNDSYHVNRRNVGVSLHPHVNMHVLSTNEHYPIFVEPDDRQNTFLTTTSEESWKVRAKAIWKPADNSIYDDRAPTGLAALLNAIDIDVAFIKAPLQTATKREMTAYFADDSVEAWLADYCEEGQSLEFPSWADLHRLYVSYARDHYNTRAKDLKLFRRVLEDANLAISAVGKTRGTDRKSFRYVKLIDPRTTHLTIVGDDHVQKQGNL